MGEATPLGDRLATLAASARQSAVPTAADRIRARGDQRRRRKRAALVSGGVALTAVLAVGALSLVRLGPEPDQVAAKPTAPSTPGPAPPAPAPGEEYASEIGYVYDAVLLEGDTVRVTVEQPHTGVVREVKAPAATPVEVRHVVGGAPGDMRLGELVSRLRGGPRWVFAVDYDGEGRVQSLREAFWLASE
ncbi:hypothetical protein [Streptomyces pratensis]|uniref:hypothetical protein n=1 Tax=Streptomyces pratensis TaxID=1169025 RepID=UPI0030196B99